jgi:hypothetical protein
MTADRPARGFIGPVRGAALLHEHCELRGLSLVVSRKTRTAERLSLVRDDDHRACRVIHDLSAYRARH